MPETFQSLLTQHIGVAFARQVAMSQWLGDHGFDLDIETGSVCFDDDVPRAVQLLGSEAYGRTPTWLWAWANPDIDPSTESLTAALALRDLGEQHAIAEFTEADFPLTQADGHNLAMVASGINDACCYYRGPYDGGAVFFLVMDVPDDILCPTSIERTTQVLMEVVNMSAVDHRTMALAFLEREGFRVRSEPSRLTAMREESILEIGINHEGLITDIGGRATSVSRKWWQFPR